MGVVVNSLEKTLIAEKIDETMWASPSALDALIPVEKHGVMDSEKCVCGVRFARFRAKSAVRVDPRRRRAGLYLFRSGAFISLGSCL
jgi:hypothetical protein